MLKYLITGTRDLIVCAVLLGMLFGYLPAAYGQRGRRFLSWGALLGLLAAAVMAYLKNKTKLIDTGWWNLRIFTVSIAAWLLMAGLDWKRLREKQPFCVAVPALGGVLAFLLLFYSLPDVLAYPYNFVLGGEAVLSTGFLYRLIGLLLGVGLCVLAAVAVEQVCRRVSPEAAGALARLALGVNALQQLSKILALLLAKRIVTNRTVFRAVRFTTNHADLFIFVILVIAVAAPAALWLRSFHVSEPYENPAQHRKIKAKWRSIRRWSSAAILSFAAAALIVTAVDAYANRPVALSAVEECEIRGDRLYIPFEQVEDGHLHRFAYTTDNKVAVRFIVIKKPNSSAYGVGLDACDICGETGYYERGNQVICNRCDVVMNINTIGFKGGCNPKVIDYSIENGYIIVPTYTLIEHESDFK